MPCALDTSEVLEYVLLNDRQKPKSEQPVFLFRYPSVRDHKKVARIYDEADQAETPTQMLDKTLEGLSVLLVGWRNVKDRKGKTKPFDLKELDDVISIPDANEFRWRVMEELSLSETQKKTSVLQLQRNTDASAVVAATPSVSTAQTV